MNRMEQCVDYDSNGHASRSMQSRTNDPWRRAQTLGEEAPNDVATSWQQRDD